MSKEQKERLSFSYPEKTQDKLKELAKKETRTLPNYIKQVLDLHVNKLKKRRR